MSIEEPETSSLIISTGDGLIKDSRNRRSLHNLSSSSLRTRSDLRVISMVPCGTLRKFLANIQEVLLGTKIFPLFVAIPLAVLAETLGFERHWVFALSLIGLAPLAERVSFLTEQIAYYTGPTVGGLLNATCGNATELIIAIFALHKRKIEVVKYSLLGSVLSNLLLVLGSSLFCGGIVNMKKEQKYDRRQTDVNSALLLLSLLCHVLPLLFRYAGDSADNMAKSALQLSRASSIIMLVAYFAYLVFQLGTHSKFFEAEEESDDNDDVDSKEVAVIGFASGIIWLVIMTAIVALLSEYVVGTIQDASDSWGLTVSFISIILLPIVGNAAEHAGAIIFGFKNKLDISLGIALGSAAQIAVFVVPLSVIAAWIMGIGMDLDFDIVETGSLALAILVTTFTLQDGTSHYMKGLILLLFYFVIAACFFVLKTSSTNANGNDIVSSAAA